MAPAPPHLIRLVHTRCARFSRVQHTHTPTPTHRGSDLHHLTCRGCKKGFYLQQACAGSPNGVEGGIKLQSLAKEGRKGKRHPRPTPLPPTAAPLQVVKVKNSRGGQEGSKGPGVAAATGRAARLPLLFSAEGVSK